MKKLLILGAAVLAMSATVLAASTPVNVKVNGNLIDAQGVIVDGRTLVPVRGIFEELGFNVTYDADTKTAYLNKVGTSVKMTYGNEYYLLNGEEITPDVPQTIIDGRFMLPLRSVGEALDLEVDWDADTKTASVSKNTGIKVIDSIDLDSILQK